MSNIETKDGDVVPSKSTITIADTTNVVPPEQDSCSPLPEDVTKRSKKRLREVSVEASTPKDDETVVPVDAKEVEVPPKKNRLQSSDRTDSEEDPQPPLPTTPPATSEPPLGTSPPHESKVRQIRKRVKDLSWQEAQRKRSDEGSAGEVDPQDDGPEAGDATSEGRAEEDDSSKSVSVKSDSDKDEAERADSDKEEVERADSDKEEVERAGARKVTTAEVAASPPTEASAPRTSPHVPSTALPEPVIAVEQPEKDSAGVTRARISPDPESCQGKRRRDDGDQNPREPKRISPPPEKEKDEPKPKPVKLAGFMAYASSTSPFATVKDAPNVFGSTNPPSTFGAGNVPKSTASVAFPSAPLTRTTPLAPQASTPVTFGTSGFSAYAATASPFAAAKASGPSPFGAVSTSASKSPSRVERSKSPGKHANAFGPYTSRSGKFAATSSRPSKKPRRGSSSNGADGTDAGTGSGSASASASGDEAGDDEPASPTSFGDILSAKENKPDVVEDEKKIEYTEQEVMTGEEDEITEYQVRAKLFAMTPGSDSGWKERGVGTLKLNVHNTTGRARLVLRTDGVLRLVLNTNLFRGMNFEIAQDPRYVKFGIIVNGKVVLHTLRLGSVRHAEDLLEQVRYHTPGH